MKTLLRLLLLVLSAALLIAVYLQHTHTTELSFRHETLYTIKWPWVTEVRKWSLFAILGWCILFAKSEPTFVRLGLVAITIAFVVMLLPFHTA
jgi:hypothetical protein